MSTVQSPIQSEGAARPICPKCHTDHAGDTKTWPYHLETFLAWQGQTLPADGLGVRHPHTTYKWAYFPVTSGQGSYDGVLHEGRLEDAYDFQVQISRQLGKKGQSHLVTNPPYLKAWPNKTTRRKDQNCEGIYIAWFDCDGGVTWHQLRDALAKAGVAAIFTESSSRQPDKWHVGLPLAKPLKFDQSVSLEKRREYKPQYRHVAAVLAALAGMQSVGKCSLDLTTSQLCQPIYPPFKLDPSDAPAKFELVHGERALDWHRFLKATGFDPERCKPKVNSKKAEQFARKVEKAMFQGDFSLLGPMGQALRAGGYLTSQWKTDGLIADCPFYPGHKGDAKYLPASDTWWCSHNSCASVRTRAARAKVVAAMGGDAVKAFNEAVALEEKEQEPQEEPKADDPGAAGNTFRWIRDQLARDDVEVERDRLLGSMTAAMIRLGIRRDYVARALAWYEPSLHARERVNYVSWRIKTNRPTAGAGWLRRTLGVHAALAFADALSRDTGQGLVTLAKGLLGMQRVRGNDADFLESVHKTLAKDDKVRATILTPKGCGIWGDKVDQWGKYIGTTHLVCETLGCGRCFFARCMIETDLLQTGWHLGGKHVEGWAKRDGPFFVHRLVGFKDTDHLQTAIDYVSRYCRSPKVRVLDWEGGAPALTFVVDNRSDSAQVGFELDGLARRDGLGYSLVKVEDGMAAAHAAIRAKINLHVQWQRLLAERDGPRLLEFTRWIKGRHLVSRSKKALPWPSREVIRQRAVEHARANAEDDAWEDFDPTAGGITYTAIHLETGYELDKREHPHQLYEVMRKAALRPKLKDIAEPPDEEWFAAHEAAWAAANTPLLACAP